MMRRIPLEVRALLFRHGIMGLILFKLEEQNESNGKRNKQAESERTVRER